MIIMDNSSKSERAPYHVQFWVFHSSYFSILSFAFTSAWFVSIVLFFLITISNLISIFEYCPLLTPYCLENEKMANHKVCCIEKKWLIVLSPYSYFWLLLWSEIILINCGKIFNLFSLIQTNIAWGKHWIMHWEMDWKGQQLSLDLGCFKVCDWFNFQAQVFPASGERVSHNEIAWALVLGSW